MATCGACFHGTCGPTGACVCRGAWAGSACDSPSVIEHPVRVLAHVLVSTASVAVAGYAAWQFARCQSQVNVGLQRQRTLALLATCVLAAAVLPLALNLDWADGRLTPAGLATAADVLVLVQQAASAAVLPLVALFWQAKYALATRSTAARAAPSVPIWSHLHVVLAVYSLVYAGLIVLRLVAGASSVVVDAFLIAARIAQLLIPLTSAAVLLYHIHRLLAVMDQAPERHSEALYKLRRMQRGAIATSTAFAALGVVDLSVNGSAWAAVLVSVFSGTISLAQSGVVFDHLYRATPTAHKPVTSRRNAVDTFAAGRRGAAGIGAAPAAAAAAGMRQGRRKNHHRKKRRRSSSQSSGRRRSSDRRGAAQPPPPMPAEDQRKREEAAIRLQSVFRGYRARKASAAARKEPAGESSQDRRKREEAAIRVQSVFRGYRVRKASSGRS